jgi:hypothetical protein
LPLFLFFNTQTMYFKSKTHTSTAVFFLKKLIGTLVGFEPRSAVSEADARSTAPRRQDARTPGRQDAVYYFGGIRTRVCCLWGWCEVHCATPQGRRLLLWRDSNPCRRHLKYRATNPGVDVVITICCDFCQFSAKKTCRVLKNQCYDQFFAKTSSSLIKNANIFAKFFCETILKIGPRAIGAE